MQYEYLGSHEILYTGKSKQSLTFKLIHVSAVEVISVLNLSSYFGLVRIILASSPGLPLFITFLCLSQDCSDDATVIVVFGACGSVADVRTGLKKCNRKKCFCSILESYECEV